MREVEAQEDWKEKESNAELTMEKYRTMLVNPEFHITYY
jgi:hypothetical protein